MVKVKRGYVLGATVCSIIAVGLSLASISTENWVQADIKPSDNSISSISHVRYGLWGGIFTQVLDTEKLAFELTMTCLFYENGCAVLCRDTKAEREQELKLLIDGEDVEFDCHFMVQKSFSVSRISSKPRETSKTPSRVFINGAAYLVTLIFLSISIVFGVGSSGLLVWNVVGNPVQTAFSIYSLYYYIGVAAATVCVVIVTWGAMFAASIMENAGILVTLTGVFEYADNPILDYSYWLNLGSLILYLASFGLLITRKYLMDNENLIMRNINQGNQVIF